MYSSNLRSDQGDDCTSNFDPSHGAAAPAARPCAQPVQAGQSTSRTSRYRRSVWCRTSIWTGTTWWLAPARISLQGPGVPHSDPGGHRLVDRLQAVQRLRGAARITVLHGPVPAPLGVPASQAQGVCAQPAREADLRIFVGGQLRKAEEARAAGLAAHCDCGRRPQGSGPSPALPLRADVPHRSPRLSFEPLAGTCRPRACSTRAQTTTKTVTCLSGPG